MKITQQRTGQFAIYDIQFDLLCQLTEMGLNVYFHLNGVAALFVSKSRNGQKTDPMIENPKDLSKFGKMNWQPSICGELPP